MKRLNSNISWQWSNKLHFSTELDSFCPPIFLQNIAVNVWKLLINLKNHGKIWIIKSRGLGLKNYGLRLVWFMSLKKWKIIIIYKSRNNLKKRQIIMKMLIWTSLKRVKRKNGDGILLEKKILYLKYGISWLSH